MKEHNTGAETVREDIDTIHSQRGGIKGLLESFLRRFRRGAHLIAMTPLYMIGFSAMSLAMTPAVAFFVWMNEITVNSHLFVHYFALGAGIVVGFFIYGFSIIFIVPVVNLLLPLRLKPFRGNYYSLSTVPWYFHNALTYIVRYTFLEFVTPTPVNLLFYRMMGMKMGKGCQINTTNISDPCLIELGDKVTIGGSAHIIAHYASRGFLIVEKVKIGDGVTVGLKATIMGDVEIGAHASIAPHEVVYPKSRIPARRRPDKN